MERSNYGKQQARPVLSADGKSMTFGQQVFHRCLDGSFRSSRTTRQGTPTKATSNETQRLRLELELEAGR